ncbi:hypothetical protein Y032_0017g3185 [Ancylostoma ceylanicum]|uniref:Uncharacterized protein n=1 Tax=Ancylostoma ceylanicum TaxID=53326 RepID=A0A016V581_9BILA|nr:hypothetical protein Y032_0017g3185 [Ancylostoma ceylanicum]
MRLRSIRTYHGPTNCSTVLQSEFVFKCGANMPSKPSTCLLIEKQKKKEEIAFSLPRSAESVRSRPTQSHIVHVVTSLHTRRAFSNRFSPSTLSTREDCSWSGLLTRFSSRLGVKNTENLSANEHEFSMHPNQDFA